MKKIFCFLICALMTAGLCVSACAYDYGTEERDALVNDFAGLMSSEDAETLNSKLEQLSELFECEVAVLTLNSANYDLVEYADDYYDYNGFGYGENDDGIMLAVDMGAREYVITTHGSAISIFNDYNIFLIENEFVSYLSEGSYTNAFIAYYEKCSDILNDYYYAPDYKDNGNYVTDDDYYYDYEYDYDYNYNGSSSVNVSYEIFSFKRIGISLAGGLIIGLIYVFFLQSKLHSVKSKRSASDYVVPGSVNITRSHDVFLYKNVHKTAKPKSNSSSGGRSGGSSFGGGGSTHVSSSGRTHGGSRGSF